MAAYTTINDSESMFQVQLYTGNGAADHAITLGGDTDMDLSSGGLVWIKNRDTTDHHCIFDTVRGVGKIQRIDYASAELDDADTLDAFQSDGFKVDADVKVNTDTEKYVAWCWKAGGGGTTTTDTNGSIDTERSTNTTGGLSIVTYTGTGSNLTCGHGLGKVPKFLWVFDRSVGGDTRGGHIGLEGHDWNYIIRMGADPAQGNSATAWNDTAPTTSLFSIGTSTNVNTSGRSYCAYVWNEVQGYSKFGSYEGNGNADGTFVYLGFRPAFIMLKTLDSTGDWQYFDDQREGYNVDNDALISETDAEATADCIDILSNGFKCRITTDPNVAETYIYCAWSKAPFVNSEGVPCNAR